MDSLPNGWSAADSRWQARPECSGAKARGRKATDFSNLSHSVIVNLALGAENTHYQGWERTGLLTATPGAVTDLDYVLDDLINLGERFNVCEIAHDPWKNLPLITGIEKRRAKAPVVEVRQTPGMLSPAMRELEALILGKAIRFDGDPVLTWMMSNVVAHCHSNDAVTPRKESTEKKSDGVLAMLMALDGAQRMQPRPNYEVRGLWFR
jgi:phage terminase large subunit-like protein